MGMKVLRTLDQPEEKYSLTFLGYGDESDTAVLELTYNYDVTEYEMGNAFGHVAIAVDDIQQAYEDIKWKGGDFSLKPVQLKGSNEIIAFVADPDGYQIELIERTRT
jgi:lactoylglutathione lyase